MVVDVVDERDCIQRRCLRLTGWLRVQFGSDVLVETCRSAAESQPKKSTKECTTKTRLLSHFFWASKCVCALSASAAAAAAAVCSVIRLNSTRLHTQITTQRIRPETALSQSVDRKSIEAQSRDRALISVWLDCHLAIIQSTLHDSKETERQRRRGRAGKHQHEHREETANELQVILIDPGNLLGKH